MNSHSLCRMENTHVQSCCVQKVNQVSATVGARWGKAFYLSGLFTSTSEMKGYVKVSARVREPWQAACRVCVCESELLQRDDGVSLCVMSHLVWTILAPAHWNITSIRRDSTNALFFNHKYCTSVMHINSQLQHIAKQGERLRKQEERDLQQAAPGSSSVMSQIQIFKDFLLIYYF